MKLGCALLFFTGVAAAARAQAPDITPAGDPSVLSDTIYRLAVDSSAHRDERYVFLLDDGVVRIESDGRLRRTYRQIIQILSPAASTTWGELTFDYNSDRERFTLNWARVVRPDGSVVSAAPGHVQESVAPVALSAPMYSDAKVVRVSLAGVGPGTIVDYSVTIERLRPPLAGEFALHWGFTNLGALTRRSRYIVDVPATLEPRIKERNVGFGRQTADVHGRRVYTWIMTEVPRVEPEPFASDSNGVVQSVSISAPIRWEDLATWYAELSRDRYALPAGIDTILTPVLKDAKAREDTLRALYRWVAQDFRYVSLDLALGAYQPRVPAEVLATRYGDCKDKATLFIALARHFGFTAAPVLLRSSGHVDPDTPALSAFDHVIAAVTLTRGPVYLDLTSDLTPFGSLPPEEPGQLALVVGGAGGGQLVTLPPDPEPATVTARFDGALESDGTLHGRFTLAAEGAEEYALRHTFEAPMGPADRSATAAAVAALVLTGSTGDSLQAFDGRDLAAPARVSLVVTHRQTLTSPAVVPLPLVGLRVPAAETASEIAARMPRRFPIDLAALGGHGESVAEFSLKLPAGWQAVLPANVTAAGPFGSTSVEYSQSDGVLRMVRRTRGATGIVAPERAGEIVAWLQQSAHDDADVIILTHAP
ncbi:MAG TPA: DUF3857 domain-containing protein [Gemmatimonadales bacterium]|nr:DUF3857 domain-containing protein [Gemmatimonadales bacterium]